MCQHDCVCFQGKSGIPGTTGEKGPQGEPVSLLICGRNAIVLGNCNQTTLQPTSSSVIRNDKIHKRLTA